MLAGTDVVPGATLALGIRLVRALQHCGDRESALRTLADVLSRGIDAPVAVWRTLPDGSTIELVGDHGLSRGQHDRIRSGMAMRRLRSSGSGLPPAFVDDLRIAFGTAGATVLDMRYGVAVVGRHLGDPGAASAEIGAILSEFPDPLSPQPSADGWKARTRSGEAEVERLRSLSAREREVLAMIADGGGTDEIAVRLSISAKTVKTHIQHLLAKLGVRSRLEAAAVAHRHRSPTG